jgi:hypothetical protein
MSGRGMRTGTVRVIEDGGEKSMEKGLGKGRG